ncbi:MAG: GTPase domain-containing protein [Promethearchaeota archaeon]
MLKPPQILFTGENGVGKTTILNLFPEDIILELDDNFNEIFQKQVNITGFKGIEHCILREIDLRELVDNFFSFQKLLQALDIILIVTDSTERNIKYTYNLFSELKYKLPKIDFYIIANFQDRKSISMPIEKIESILKEKVFGYSAIQEDSKDSMTEIIKEILEISIIKKQGKKLSFDKIDYNTIWSDIEEARLLEKKGDHYAASKKFSIAGSKFKILNSNEEKEEFKALYNLCKAWECIELAEEYENISKFAEADKFFDQAIESLSDEKLKFLVSANLAHCEALKLGMKSDTSDQLHIKEKLYLEIVDLINQAVNLYKRGGFEKEAEFALTTLNKLKSL